MLRLARNCGQSAALSAGVDRARGEVIVFLDGDGQNDPHDIPALLGELNQGYGVVSGWRRRRQDALLTRRLPSILGNLLVRKISGVKVRDLGCSLKAYRREDLENLRL